MPRWKNIQAGPEKGAPKISLPTIQSLLYSQIVLMNSQKSQILVMVISLNKNQETDELIITLQFGVKFSWYWGKVGPVAHLTTQQSPVCGITLSHIVKAPPVCYLHCCERRNSFPRFCLYFRHTYFMVHLVMAISAKPATRILLIKCQSCHHIETSQLC